MPIVIYDGITIGSPSPPPPPPPAPCPACIGPPTFVGFQSFITQTMGINTTILPITDPVICMAYTMSVSIVNRILACISNNVYTLCVYNLGGSNIINYAQDQPGAPVYLNGLPFFQYLRQKWNISGYVSGTIQASSDVSTSESMVVPDYAKDMNLQDLQLIKDPYGRQYLALAQNFGPLWGIS